MAFSQGTGPATGGAHLELSVDLPRAARAADAPTPEITVTGPDGKTFTLRASGALHGLAPGAYEVRPADLWLAGARFVALPGRTRLTLAQGEHVVVPLAYVNAEEAGVHGDPVPQALRPGSTTYFVDCVTGSDSASGTAPWEAWRTLERLAGTTLRPGDRLLLQRGCVWTGPLRVPWQGTAEWPVTIGAYGEGALPAIRDSSLNHVDVTGSFVVIEQLQAFTSPGAVPVDEQCANQPVGWRTGFTLQHEANNVTIRHSLAYGNTAGIHITRGSRHNRLLNNVLTGNVIMSVNTDDGGSDDSGAWGVVLNGTDNVVAYNRFSGNNAWCSYDFGQEGASIEIYEAQRNLIHHNVSIGDTTFSELGSSDFRDSEDNTFAFNVYVSNLPNSEFLVLRGARAHFGPTPGTRVFHNTAYLTHPEETQGVVCYSGCGPDVLELRNNIIWAEWKGLFADAPLAESNNLFWNSRGRPLLQFFGEGNAMSPTSLVADPRFRDPASGDLRLAPGSPAIGAGVPIDLGFARDVNGVLLKPAGEVDMGANQVR